MNTCSVCQATFRRPEHRNRHFRAVHQTGNSYICQECGKTFNRSDSYRRHVKSHRLQVIVVPPTPGTLRTCINCAEAKVKCLGGAECSRCQKKGLVCIYPKKRQRISQSRPDQDVTPRPIAIPTIQPFTAVDAPEYAQEGPSNQGLGYANNMLNRLEHDTIHEADSSRMSINWPGQFSGQTINQNRNGCLEPSIQTPGLSAGQYDFNTSINWLGLDLDPTLEIPPVHDGIFDQMQTATSVAGSLQTVTLEDDRSLSQSVTSDKLINTSFPRPSGSSGSSGSSGRLLNSSGRNGTVGSGSFYMYGNGPRASLQQHRSPTDPSSALGVGQVQSQYDGFRFETTTLDLADVSEQLDGNELDYISESQYLELQNYFKLLATETSAASTPFLSEDFPPIQYLNFYLKTYSLMVQLEFPVIHHTKLGLTTDWILTLAKIATGSIAANVPTQSQTRAAFQEFLRRAILFFEERQPDLNKTVLLQARLLSVMGLLQSSNSNLRSRLAYSHAELVTGLQDCLLTMNAEFHPGATLEDQWERWIEQETRKRLIYFGWQIDCGVNTMTDRNWAMVSEIGDLEMPAHSTIWMANTANEWNTTLEAYGNNLSLDTTLQSLYLNHQVQVSIDCTNNILLIHAIWRKTIEIGANLQKPLAEWVPVPPDLNDSRTISLKGKQWLPANPTYSRWRNSACDCLDVLHWKANSEAAAAAGIEGLEILHLHLARIILLTPFKDIEKLAISMGKPEAMQSSLGVRGPLLNEEVFRWLTADQHKGRLVLAHAGAILWYARRYSVHSYYEPTAVYFATLTLWAYGSYKRSANGDQDDLHSHSSTRGESDVDSEEESMPNSILLDRPCDDEIIQIFVKHGNTMAPNLSGVGNICAPTSPAKIAKQGVKILNKCKGWAWERTGTYIQTLSGLL